MSDNIEKPAPEGTLSTPPGSVPGSRDADEPKAKPEGPQSNGAAKGVPEADPREALKKGLEANRLPAELRARMLAELPPPEERERQLRELLEHGGLSAEEFFASLGMPIPQKP